MLSNSSLLLLLGAATATTNSIRSKGINWGPCSMDGTLPIDCANFTVPLDYTDANSNETLELNMLRVPAINGPARGSIFFNFGGPGVEVRNSLAGRAHIIQAVTSGHHYLIGIDPRGTANTLTFKCYANYTERALARGASGAGLGNASDVALGAMWVTGRIFADNCFKNPESRRRGDLIGIAFTARDMMRVLDALGEDGLLRYWGLSYGTALGATVVSMFPDRMDKVILDGVINPHDFYHGPELQNFADADATLTGFIDECLKAPNECALAGNNTNAAELEASIYNFIWDLKYLPIEINGIVVEYNTLKATIRAALYRVSSYPPLSRALNGLLTKNYTQFLEASAELSANTPDIMEGLRPDDSPYGIHCGDKLYRKESLDEARPDFERLTSVSKLMGDVSPVLTGICAKWKMQAKERYEGDFHVRTKTPVLVIGNSYDLATSIDAAYNVSAGFVDSVLLRQDGFGHCTPAQPSICTSRAIKAYFDDGVVPQQGAVCGTDVPPFSNKTFDDILPELGFNMSKKLNVSMRDLGMQPDEYYGWK